MPQIEFKECDRDFLVCSRDKVPELSVICTGNDLRDAIEYHGKRFESAGGGYCECNNSNGRYVSRITIGIVINILLRTEALTLNSNPYQVELSSKAATTYIGDTIEEALIASLADSIREEFIESLRGE